MFKCIHRSGDLETLTLQDEDGSLVRMSRNELKELLLHDGIKVSNLKLDNNMRLISKMATAEEKAKSLYFPPDLLYAILTNRDMSAYLEATLGGFSTYYAELHYLVNNLSFYIKNAIDELKLSEDERAKEVLKQLSDRNFTFLAEKLLDDYLKTICVKRKGVFYAEIEVVPEIKSWKVDMISKPYKYVGKTFYFPQLRVTDYLEIQGNEKMLLRQRNFVVMRLKNVSELLMSDVSDMLSNKDDKNTIRLLQNVKVDFNSYVGNFETPKKIHGKVMPNNIYMFDCTCESIWEEPDGISWTPQLTYLKKD